MISPGSPEARPVPPGEVGTVCTTGNWAFSPARAGQARYRSTMAALPRACLRLGARGLVTCVRGELSRWPGVEITAKGREWLAAHNRDKSPGR
jgi:hypothetical protein